MLHVIYRSYGGENKKGRPEYYSKLLSLASLIRSFQKLPTSVAELIYLNDGPIPKDRLQAMERTGEVIARSNLGLAGSLRSGLMIAATRGWREDDLVWFSEDDYLYHPDALSELLAAAKAFPDVSYFGLYALIGSRMPNGKIFEDLHRVPENWTTNLRGLVNGRSWCRALSTTSTFGARVGVIRADRSMMSIAMRARGSFDHSTCLMYQGYIPYPFASLAETFLAPGATSLAKRIGVLGVRLALNTYQITRDLGGAKRHVLLTSDPPMITHLENAYMAAGTDWSAIAEATSTWMQDHLTD